MMHVQIDEGNAVVGVFANAQPFTLQMADDDPRIAVWRRAQIAPQIAAECQQRIFAVASQNCQMNMTAWIASGRADDSDRAAFDAALGWVQAMRSACAALVATGDVSFPDDANWPPCPPEVAALAARF